MRTCDSGCPLPRGIPPSTMTVFIALLSPQPQLHRNTERQEDAITTDLRALATRHARFWLRRRPLPFDFQEPAVPCAIMRNSCCQLGEKFKLRCPPLATRESPIRASLPRGASPSRAIHRPTCPRRATRQWKQWPEEHQGAVSGGVRVETHKNLAWEYFSRTACREFDSALRKTL